MLINLPLKIPMLDIDILVPGFSENLKASNKATNLAAEFTRIPIDAQHIRRMQYFHNNTELGVQPARTLDEYVDMDLCGENLKRYNLDQVLSRWFNANHNKDETSVRSRNYNASQRGARNVASKLRKQFPRATGGLPLTAGTLALDVESRGNSELQERPNRLILVVSQLWLFKFGGTSSPSRQTKQRLPYQMLRDGDAPLSRSLTLF